jgi:5'-deoxynucleotidase YfbR-like HD superfamily hydrolase
MEKQYEREREAERRAEKECIRTVGEINKKIDKIQTIIQKCNEQGRQTNTNLSSFISQTRRKRKKDKKNMLFFGILSGLTALFYYYKKRK